MRKANDENSDESLVHGAEYLMGLHWLFYLPDFSGNPPVASMKIYSAAVNTIKIRFILEQIFVFWS